MKKIFALIAVSITIGTSYAQVDTASHIPAPPPAPKTKKVYNLTNRPNDHFMLQLGYLVWKGQPDSIQSSGFPRSINAYFMFDFPFKNSPRFSAAIGLGIGSDQVVFKKQYPDLNGPSKTLMFNGPDTATFKKTKLAVTYLELPVELRYVANPENSDKSFKVALGVKAGTMIKAGTRSRSINNPAYIQKIADKRYFNTTRIVGTARVGFGHIGVFGTYQFTNLLKDAVGPPLHPVTIGLTFTGL